MASPKTRNKGRAPGMTTITFGLEESAKESLKKRVDRLNEAKGVALYSISDLVRVAVIAAEKNNWKDFPEFAISKS